jgi:hypothetical protein
MAPALVLSVLLVGSACAGGGTTSRAGKVEEQPVDSGAAAVPVNRPGGGAQPWSGTVRSSFSYTYEQGRTKFGTPYRGGSPYYGHYILEASGSVAYSDLKPLVADASPNRSESAVTQSWDYSAVVAGSGSAKLLTFCAPPGEVQPLDGTEATYSWTAGGRDNAAANGMNSMSITTTDHYDPATGELRGTAVYPHALWTVATGPSCEGSEEFEINNGVEGWGDGLLGRDGTELRDQLVPDSDPDPDRLVGSTTFTFAPETVPSYDLTISYDLSRGPAAEREEDDPAGCRGKADARGFTALHYDADLQLAAAPDPDFFDWDLSAVWCVKDGKFAFGTTDSSGASTVDPAVGTPLETLFGITFRFDPDDKDAFFVPVAGGSVGELSASADFDVCVAPFTLLTAGAGRAITAVADRAAGAVMARLPDGVNPEEWLVDVAARIEFAAAEAVVWLDDSIREAISSSQLRRLLPDGLLDEIKKGNKVPTAVQAALIRAFDVVQDRFVQYSNRFYNGQRWTTHEEARQAWVEVTTQVASAVAGALSATLQAQTCHTVWRPVVTVSIPRHGSSRVDESRLRGTVFDVKGGLVKDTRGA